MMYSERQTAFGQMKQKSLPTQCKECEFFICLAMVNAPKIVFVAQQMVNRD